MDNDQHKANLTERDRLQEKARGSGLSESERSYLEHLEIITKGSEFEQKN
jgi:hypothetical protein